MTARALALGILLAFIVAGGWFVLTGVSHLAAVLR